MASMSRKNLTISVTVFSAASPTFVPTNYLPVSPDTTHFVDLIEVSDGYSSVKQQIYLEGKFVPGSNVFIFMDSAVNRIAELFNQAFPTNPYMMKKFVEQAVALNISTAPVTK